jgi:hypothetical protein
MSISLKAFTVSEISLKTLNNLVNNFSTGNNIWDIFFLEVSDGSVKFSINGLSISNALVDFTCTNKILLTVKDSKPMLKDLRNGFPFSKTQRPLLKLC